MNYSFEGFLAALAAAARNVPHHMLSLVSAIRLFFGQMVQGLELREGGCCSDRKTQPRKPSAFHIVKGVVAMMVNVRSAEI